MTKTLQEQFTPEQLAVIFVAVVGALPEKKKPSDKKFHMTKGTMRVDEDGDISGDMPHKSKVLRMFNDGNNAAIDQTTKNLTQLLLGDDV